MGTKVENEKTYYFLLFLFFLHQLINNWINEVTYPWIINCVQDPKSNNIIYSKRISMIIINMFSIYSELDVILIISGIVSQFTFFVMIILANIISISLINWQYIKKKDDLLFIPLSSPTSPILPISPPALSPISDSSLKVDL
jgi:hypothetical protein